MYQRSLLKQYEYSHLNPKRVVRGYVFVLIQAEDALLEDKFRLRGSHLRSEATIVVLPSSKRR